MKIDFSYTHRKKKMMKISSWVTSGKTNRISLFNQVRFLNWKDFSISTFFSLLCISLIMINWNLSPVIFNSLTATRKKKFKSIEKFFFLNDLFTIFSSFSIIDHVVLFLKLWLAFATIFLHLIVHFEIVCWSTLWDLGICSPKVIMVGFRIWEI